MTEEEKVEALLAQLEWIETNRTEVQRLQAEIRRLGYVPVVGRPAPLEE